MSDTLQIVSTSGEGRERALLGPHGAAMHDFRDFSYAAKEDDRLVGGVVAESTGDMLEVSYLYVHEGHRGQGLGTALMEHLEEQAIEAGMSRIMLDAYSFQGPELYHKLGYTEAAVLPAPEGHTHHYFMKELGERSPSVETE